MIFQSDYWCIDRTIGAKDVCIVFSAANTKKGSFLLRKALRDFPCHKIFVNCVGNSWYLDGIPGLGTTLKETARSLSSIVSDLKSDGSKIITVGCSMGGYAAILVGSILNANYTFATGAQLFLGLEGSLSKKIDFKKYENVDPSLFIDKSSTKIFWGVGEDCFADIYCLSHFRNRHNENITAFSIRNYSHSIPPVLQNKHGFNFILSQILEKGEISNIAPEGIIWQHPDLCKALYNTTRLKNKLDEDADALISVFDHEISRLGSSYCGAYAHYGKALVCGLTKRSSEALEHHSRAVSLNTENFRFLDSFARELVKNKDYSAAERLVERSLDLQNREYSDNDPFTRILYSRILNKRRKLVRSLGLLTELVARDPKRIYIDLLQETLATINQHASDSAWHLLAEDH